MIVEEIILTLDHRCQWRRQKMDLWYTLSCEFLREFGFTVSGVRRKMIYGNTEVKNLTTPSLLAFTSVSKSHVEHFRSWFNKRPLWCVLCFDFFVPPPLPPPPPCNWYDVLRWGGGGGGGGNGAVISGTIIFFILLILHRFAHIAVYKGERLFYRNKTNISC